MEYTKSKNWNSFDPPHHHHQHHTFRKCSRHFCHNDIIKYQTNTEPFFFSFFARVQQDEQGFDVILSIHNRIKEKVEKKSNLLNRLEIPNWFWGTIAIVAETVHEKWNSKHMFWFRGFYFFLPSVYWHFHKVNITSCVHALKLL